MKTSISHKVSRWLLPLAPILLVAASSPANLCGILSRESILSQAVEVGKSPVSKAASQLPFRKILPAGSEQTPALSIGAKPYQQVHGDLTQSKGPVLWQGFERIGNEQAKRLAAKNGWSGNVSFEVWPIRNEYGVFTWVFARYRLGPEGEWQWLRKDQNQYVSSSRDTVPEPVLPEVLDTSRPEILRSIFADFESMGGLYDKPVFGDTVWVERKNSQRVAVAWPMPESRNEMRPILEGNSDLSAMRLPRPAEQNGQPKTLVLEVNDGKVNWSEEIRWHKGQNRHVDALAQSRQIREFSSTFDQKYKEEVESISGTKEARFPISKKSERYTRKSSHQKDNQIASLVSYLAEGYKSEGIESERIEFEWNGVKQYMLIAKIRGSLPPESNRPILLADHIDTAYAEEVFETSGKRVSVPGSNDNVTAVATLTQGAKELKKHFGNQKPLNDIWFTHLTGEEFPADCLGARYLTAKVLSERQKIGGVVLLDMIGFAGYNGKDFQINAGDSPHSLTIAQTAMGAAKNTSPELNAVLRTYEDPMSYLYNTDGIIFSDAGIPVVLFNEPINRSNYTKRSDYHTMGDNGSNVNYPYASSIARTAIETVAQLSMKQLP